MYLNETTLFPIAHNASYGQDAREIHSNGYEHFPGISHNGKEKAVLLQI